VQQAEVPGPRAAQLAKVAFRCGKFREAAAWADKALVADPQDASLLHLRAKSLECAGNIPGRQQQ
jgi:Flp pilus assembly protein TadD